MGRNGNLNPDFQELRLTMIVNRIFRKPGHIPVSMWGGYGAGSNGMDDTNRHKRLDIFIITDAVLISLSCLLIFAAYREVTVAPVRHAREIAQTVLAISSDLPSDAPAGEASPEDEQAALKRRVDEVARRMQMIEPAAKLNVYTELPQFRGLSGEGDDFLKQSLTAARQNANAGSSITVKIAGRWFVRSVAALLASSDCARCVENGTADYRRGDVIGVREVVMPVSDANARIIRNLLFTFALLSAALMCVLGVIFPMIKRSRAEREEITGLAEDLERQTITDPLTGLHNRRYFETALASCLNDFRGRELLLGLLVFDVDHFKSINDTHGHDAGDLALTEVARQLKAITREGNVVARIGGEEFAVITPCVSIEQLAAIAERYRRMIGSLKLELGNVTLRLTISVGAAINRDRSISAAEMFKQADKKLYKAKRSGRNRVAA